MTANYSNTRLGPRAKIERAKEHLAEFERVVNAFVANDPYEFVVQKDSDGSEHVFLKSHKPIPLRFSTIAGDIIHNARSALDLLVTCGGEIESGVVKNLKFPIRASRDDFEKNAFNKSWQDCPRTRRLVEKLKPYERGYDLGHHGHTLCLLNRLSNRDKHSLLVVIGTAAAKAVVTPRPGFGDAFELAPPDTALLSDGDVVISFSPHHPLFAGRDFDTQLTVQIRFGGMDVARVPWVGAHANLAHIIKIVERIVLIAERTLFV